MGDRRDDDRVGELVERWEERRAGGEEVDLESLCAGCPECLDEVRWRVEALRELGDAFEDTEGDDEAPGGTAVPRESASCGATYRELQFLARGGLGEVFLARNEELGREVALKFIRRDLARHPEYRRRFLREAEVTGRLEHPGIVPVYGLGCDDRGAPCYAMQLVRGETLESAVAAFHRPDRDGRDPRPRAVAFRELLGRFVAVCRTIEYAHSRGTLHRDLKPRNIMVGPYGEALVVDWGLAKILDGDGDGSATPVGSGDGPAWRTRTTVGTPAYMSPEQAEGPPERVGPAADIYGLGATLYALLTGRAPFEGETPEIFRRKARGDFPAPRRVAPRVAPVLEAICLKAMATDPVDRYPTAGAVADDLARWLADEPVSAYRESWVQRLARWSRRHRTWVRAGAVALAVVAVVATVAAVWVARARRVAEHRFEVALEAARTLSETVAARIEPLAGAHVRHVEETLVAAGSIYEKLMAEAGDDLRVLEGKARMLLAFADVYLAAGRPDQSLASADETIRLYRQLLAARPGRPWQVGLAAGLDKAGRARANLGRYREAAGDLRQAIALGRSAVARSPDDDARAVLARSLADLGVTLNAQGDEEGSARAHREALGIRQAIARPGDSPARQADLLVSEEAEADALYARNDLAGALAAYTRLLGRYDVLAAREAGNTKWQQARARLCSSIARTHSFERPDEAVRWVERCARIAERLTDLDPTNMRWRHQQLSAQFARSYYRHETSTAQMVDHSRKTVDLFRDARKEALRDVVLRRGEVGCRINLAQLLITGDDRLPREERLAEAARLLEAARALREEGDGFDPTDQGAMSQRVKYHEVLAQLRKARGDEAGAEASIAMARRIEAEFESDLAARRSGQTDAARAAGPGD